MNQRQFASVLFAILGLFVAVSRFPEILIHAGVLLDWTPTYQDPTEPYSQRLVSIMGLSGSLILVLVGLGLVFLRDRLADRLFPIGTEPLAVGDFQAVAFSVLGCYFVVQGFSRFVWAGQLRWDGATKVVLGLALFFGARGLSRFWLFLRSAGT